MKIFDPRTHKINLQRSTAITIITNKQNSYIIRNQYTIKHNKFTQMLTDKILHITVTLK